MTAHDGFTLRDLVTYNQKHNEANGEDNNDGSSDNRSWNCGVEGETDDPKIIAMRNKQMRNFMATLLLAQGTPMIVAGDEFGRTQGGNNNAYCQDSEIGWIDWNLSEDGKVLLDFTRKLGDLRHRYPVLRRNRFYTGKFDEVHGVKDVTWIRSDGSEVGAAGLERQRDALRGHADGRPRTAQLRPAGRGTCDDDAGRQCRAATSIAFTGPRMRRRNGLDPRARYQQCGEAGSGLSDR